MTVVAATFGALSEVQMMHAIYHFKAQEVNNPMLQTVCNSEKHFAKCCEITLLLRSDFAAFLYSRMFLLLTMPNLCREREARNLKMETPRRHPLVISCVLLMGNPKLRITLNGINFVDQSLNQGAPAGHESAETPIGHKSNGAVAGEIECQVCSDTIW
ncbi:hypothetical protein AAG906_007413 [Vitis piasezkii]